MKVAEMYQRYCPKCRAVTWHEPPSRGEPDTNTPPYGTTCDECGLEHDDIPMPGRAVVRTPNHGRGA